MPHAYATKRDLEKRLSADVVRRIYDDNNDGDTDSDAVDALLFDATAKVDSYFSAVTSVPIGMVGTPPVYPREVIRLTLDVAEAYAAKRHPEVVARDWEKLMKAAEADLMKYRKGETKLGASPPDPAANHGAMVGADSPRVQEEINRGARTSQGIWSDTGDF
jgi:phage gp36-like protein